MQFFAWIVASCWCTQHLVCRLAFGLQLVKGRVDALELLRDKLLAGAEADAPLAADVSVYRFVSTLLSETRMCLAVGGTNLLLHCRAAAVEAGAGSGEAPQ